MKSILITGCNRGIGLGLVKHLVKEKKPPQTLIATCRNPDEAEELRKIAATHKNVHVLKLDLKKFEIYPEFSKKVAEIVKENGLNVLFNNAAISPKFTRLNLVKVEQLVDTLATNTVAPIMLTKALLPLLKRSAFKNATNPFGIEKAAVINMSSVLASNELNTTGGLYPYRCSKAALNIATKTMSVDLKTDGILATCLHPGWVKTALGGEKAPMEIAESVSNILKLLRNLEERHNGGFFKFDGEPLPW